VVTVMREFKAQLLAQEASQMQQMAKRWIEVEQSLDAYISALVQEIDEKRRLGQPVSESQIFQLRRYQELLRQAEVQFAQYVAWADEEIVRQQGRLARLGLDHAAQAIQASYWPSMGVAFDRLSVEAVEIMIGLAGNGAPIGELLRLRMLRDANGQPLPGVWSRLTRTLIESTAIGRNPRQTARMMRNDLAGGLNKALVIARTEQLRVYRMAATQQYRDSGVVRGHKRLSAHDGRVCAACLADEGTVYSIDEVIPDHPQGRCTGVPIVKGMPGVNWLSGENWLKAQPADTQRQILGGSRWDVWQEGAFAFSALVTHTHSSEWGGGVTPTPLSQLVN
jgi:SPP1 gp7 family putative phage head morphogenesis protein